MYNICAFQTWNMSFLHFSVQNMYRFFNTNMYRFDQSDKCARQITLIFKKKVHEEGHSWKNLTNEMLNLYWEEFQVRFIYTNTYYVLQI